MTVIVLGDMSDPKLELIFTGVTVDEVLKIVEWGKIYNFNGDLIDSANPESLKQTLIHKGKSFVATIRGISLRDDCYMFEDVIKYEVGE